MMASNATRIAAFAAEVRACNPFASGMEVGNVVIAAVQRSENGSIEGKVACLHDHHLMDKVVSEARCPPH